MAKFSGLNSFFAIAFFCFLNIAAMPTPNGWQAKTEGTNLIWSATSPRYNTNILIMFDKADNSRQALQPWFEAQIRDLGNHGTISERHGISADPGILKDTFLLRQGDDNYRAFVFAYDTARGKQIILVMMEGVVNVNDPVVQSAFDKVAEVWRARAALNTNLQLDETIAVPASRPMNSAAPKQVKTQAKASPAKGRCRDEVRTINTMRLQQVCYPSMGGMMNCQLQSVPSQQNVLQTQCY